MVAPPKTENKSAHQVAVHVHVVAKVTTASNTKLSMATSIPINSNSLINASNNWTTKLISPIRYVSP
jgi:hypothetical protein